MYRRILLAFDGSHAGRRALLECADIEHVLQAELHLLAAVPPAALVYTPGGFGVEGRHEESERQFRAVLDEGLSLLGQRGVKACGHLATGEPVDVICEYSSRLRCDLVMVGHQRRSTWLEHLWKGSVGASLMDRAPCSVLVALSE